MHVISVGVLKTKFALLPALVGLHRLFRLKPRFLYDPVLVILHDLEAMNYDSYEFCTTPVLLLLVVMEVATDATVSPSMRNHESTLLSDRPRTSSP